jgi:hypothetical protein
MPTLSESRETFRQAVHRWTPHEVPQFTLILDDFIAWSSSQAALEHADHDYDQGVVSFRESSGRIFWSAYPKGENKHGAKFEILPGSADRLTNEAREQTLAVLKELSNEPISMDTTLRIRFAAMRSTARRDRIKKLLETLMVQLATTTS